MNTIKPYSYIFQCNSELSVVREKRDKATDITGYTDKERIDEN